MFELLGLPPTRMSRADAYAWMGRLLGIQALTLRLQPGRKAFAPGTDSAGHSRAVGWPHSLLRF